MSPLDAGADDDRLRGFQRTFADNVDLPAGASVIDEPVTVVEVAYDGNPRRGLTARCRTGNGREHVVALADVRFPEGSEAASLVASYRAWLGLEITPDARPSVSHARATSPAVDSDIDLSRPHLVTLLPLEQGGLTHELVRQRRALRQLDENFFRYYMAVMEERRSSS